jgi:hypothetical protein
MRAPQPTVTEQPVPAPRALRTLAGLIDAAVFGLLAALYLRRMWRRGPGADGDLKDLPRRTRPLGLAVSVIEEQLGTPGGWIVGLRTVDLRTGRRLALWRTLAVAITRLVTEAASRRLVPAPPSIPVSEREEFGRELRAIEEAYPGDGGRLAEASSRFDERHRVEMKQSRWLSRWLLAVVVPALINRRLRRHVAPTVVVVSPRRLTHSP